MSVDAQEIIDDAIDALQSASTSEARQRAVISRAYYAVYHFLRDHGCGQPFAKGTVGRPGGLHRHFITWLYQSKEPSVMNVAMKLDGLFDNRVMADYKINASFPKHLAQDSIDMVCEIIDVDLTTMTRI
jgi:hypothetical protein